METSTCSYASAVNTCTETCEISNVPSLEEILSHNGLKKKDLDRECTQDIRWDIGVQIIHWKMIGRYLGIPEWKLVVIVRDHSKYGEEECRVQLLNTWHIERKGKKATCLELITAFHRGGYVALADTLCKMIIQKQPSEPGLLP